VSDDDQAVRGERLQGVPDDAGPDAPQSIQLGDRRQLVARGENLSPRGTYIPSLTWEPVSGLEPLTCRLQEVCSQAAHALAAPMAQSIALMAPTALGLFGASSHEPFHADGGQKSIAVTERSGQAPPQRRRNLPWSDRTVEQIEQIVALPNCAVLGSSGAAVRHRVRRSPRRAQPWRPARRVRAVPGARRCHESSYRHRH
jgi:hypothetical protein